MHEDTAEGIANEMMEDLSLSDKEAKSIAAKIKEEIQRMAAKPAENGAQPTGMPPLPPAPASGPPPLDVRLPTVDHPASAPAASLPSPSLHTAPRSGVEQARTSASGMRLSGNQTPEEGGKRGDKYLNLDDLRASILAVQQSQQDH